MFYVTEYSTIGTDTRKRRFRAIVRAWTKDIALNFLKKHVERKKDVLIWSYEDIRKLDPTDIIYEEEISG